MDTNIPCVQDITGQIRFYISSQSVKLIYDTNLLDNAGHFQTNKLALSFIVTKISACPSSPCKVKDDGNYIFGFI